MYKKKFCALHFMVLFIIAVSAVTQRAFSSQVQQIDRETVREFFEAVERGNLDEVRRYITLVPELIHECKTYRGVWQTNSLCFAAKYGHLDIVRFLLAHGARIGVSCDGYSSPLHVAAEVGHLHIVKVLVTEYKTSINLENNDQQTPLHRAAWHIRKDVVQWLLDHGALQSKDSYKCTPFYLTAGATLFLHSACDVEDIVSLLYAKGADLESRDCNQETPLHRAVKAKNFRVISFLMRNNASVDPVNKSGMTPLCCAIDAGAFAIVMFLVKQGASIDRLDKKNGATPLHCALKAYRDRMLRFRGDGDEKKVMIKLLLGFGVPIESREEIKWLHAEPRSGFDMRKIIRDRRREIEEVLLGEPSRAPAMVQRGVRWLACRKKLPRFFAVPMQWSLSRGAKLPGMNDLPDDVIRVIIDMVVTPSLPDK